LGRVCKSRDLRGCPLTSDRHDNIEKQKTLVLQRRGNLQTPSQRNVYKKLYKHTFLLARAPGQKGVLLDNAIEYWRLLFSPPAIEWKTAKSPFLDWWIEFLESQWKKSVNKDMWDQTLVFAEKTLEDESLSFWDENSAWPSVIDDFVEWVREKRGDSGAPADDMDIED
jgi:DCN1-like protein 1/2